MQTQGATGAVTSKLLIVVLVVHALLLTLVALVLPGPRGLGFLLAIVTGVLLGQAVVGGTWLMLLTKHRLLVSVCVFASAICFTVYAARTGAESITAMIVGVAVLAQLLLACVPLAVFRSLGWKLSQSLEEASGRSVQFQISHILFWTTGIAVVIGLGRILVPTFDPKTFRGGEGVQIASYFLLYTLGNAFLVGPVLWAFFVRHRKSIWIGLSCFSFAAVGLAERYVFMQLKWFNGLGQASFFVGLLNAAFVVTLLSFFIPLRLQKWTLAKS